MTTAGGGWTLVSSVHEDDMYGKCTAGDRWSSTRGNNMHTFGSMGSATSDDYKNPGYFSISASNIMLWHVPNNVPPKEYKTAAYLRYRTSDGFLDSYGFNLYTMFKDHFPIGYGLGTRTHDNGPAIPITNRAVIIWCSHCCLRTLFHAMKQFRDSCISGCSQITAAVLLFVRVSTLLVLTLSTFVLGEVVTGWKVHLSAVITHRRTTTATAPVWAGARISSSLSLFSCSSIAKESHS
uniref:Fibrinogen C-terminal domain-containing protein n=1 Tax=Branchiostoma floridae TaxID=7739 RepID=C3Y7U5_BRAFL|eukprot:XP_002607590.1 hypothetical protein BRAFLDRAFT_71468 [Branchiostoma floridae]